MAPEVRAAIGPVLARTRTLELMAAGEIEPGGCTIVFVQGPDGPVKAHAVFAKCVSTKYLWVRVTAGAPRGRDVALLLWDMAGGEETFASGVANRPGQSVPALPRNVLALNLWRSTGAPPAWLPGAIVLDHGPKEESHRLIRYCAQIGVTILWAATREPTDKAYVESVISEFARACQLIPGHEGNAVGNRPSADPQRIPTTAMPIGAYARHPLQLRRKACRRLSTEPRNTPIHSKATEG